MKSKLALTVGLAAGILIGSKIGPKPWNTFSVGMRWLRNNELVSKSIETAADNVSDAVRRKGEQMSDRAADAVRRRIMGDTPVLIEARVVDEESS